MRTLLTALILLLGPHSAFAQQTPLGPPPGRLVDIGGHKMHLYCTGTGAPTVVLEAGASSFAIDWQLVQPEVARNNRVCAYDRLGYGWSDPNTGTDAHVIGNLHSLLQQSGERPPFVLVGASRGGLYVRMYQATYPNEVVGLVLVDPTHEERLYTMFEGKALPIASLTTEQLRTTIAPSGYVQVPRRKPQQGRPFDLLPPELYETRMALEAKLIESIPDSVSNETVWEHAEADRSILAYLRDQRRVSKRPLGDLPLVILTRGVDSDNERILAYDELSKMSSNSRHTVVIGAGHEIHLFKPEVVVEAIKDAVNAARADARLKAR
jgi:pimeloyl-ACP methyl ester carboxylesterase